MTRLLLAFALLSASVASAQNYQTPTEADFARLPMAVNVVFPVPTGWTGLAEFWVHAIWNRNVMGSGSGAWFRAAPEQPVIALYRENVFPRPYTCRFVGRWRFDCSDVFGEVRQVACPASITANSEPTEFTTERGRFMWTWPGADERWKAWSERITLPNSSGNVSEDGKRVVCHYAVTKATGGEYDRTDLWVQWR